MMTKIVTPPTRVFDVGKDPRSGLHPRPGQPLLISGQRARGERSERSLQPRGHPLVRRGLEGGRSTGSIRCRARGERGTAGRGARIPDSCQIRMPRVKTAIRSVSETVRRTRSIVGMLRATTGEGAGFGARMTSRWLTARSVVRERCMVTIGGWDVIGGESAAAMCLVPN